MAKNNTSSNEEPSIAPEPDRWYNITLGSSFKDHHNYPSPKFCTLRYEFKPASIDKSQPGSLRKRKDKKVTVEYHNNQHGRPKVIFEGVTEDYKENDAVLFFDGGKFCLERLHLAVKRLRHVRLPGEPATGAATATSMLVAPAVESNSQPSGKKSTTQSPNKVQTQQMPVQVEQIGKDKSESLESKDGKNIEHPLFPSNPSAASPDPDELKDQVEFVNDDVDGSGPANVGNVSEKESRTSLGIDINLPHEADTDDEIADVDISDDEVDKGPNAAEALRAQVNAEGRTEQTSSSSSSSESDSSGSEDESGSGSSSSDSESSDGDSVISI